MEKVSIIIPIFNAELYLSEAIESVLKQTYTDFELLLIDDQSTDFSKEICKEYMKKDDRVVLLENNHGPGPTRNIGLDYATGKYIYFMDADDWIEERLLETTVNCISKTNADIVQFGVKNEHNKGIYLPENYFDEFYVFTKDDIKQNIITFLREKNCYLWIHLFKYETVKNIKFEYIMNGEDVSFVMDAFCKANTIAYIPEIFYHYRYVDGSTCHRWVPRIIDCLEVQWKHTKKFLDSFDDGLDPSAYAEEAYFEYVWAIYQLCLRYCPLSFKEKKRRLIDMKNRMDFEVYRDIYPLKMQHGLMRVKYSLVKYHFEWLILLMGPWFLRFFRE